MLDVAVSCERLGIVLAPDGSEQEAEGILNPGVVRDASGSLLLYPRMVAPGNVSRIGLVRVNEAEGPHRYERLGVVLEPSHAEELRSIPGGYGCEDARVTFVPTLGKYIMTYTAFGPRGPRIAIASSDDGLSFVRHGLVRFADERLNHLPNKDAAFFPEPVRSPDGQRCFAFYHRPMLAESINGQAPIAFIQQLPVDAREATCIAYVPADDVVNDTSTIVNAVSSVVVLPVGDAWGNLKNGCGTPPIRTAAGWLSVFHGVDARGTGTTATLVYRAGIVVHDIERPDRVLYRSHEPFLDPETPDERFGTVDDVVFPTGLDVVGPDVYDVYYGAADTKIAKARIAVDISHATP